MVITLGLSSILTHNSTAAIISVDPDSFSEGDNLSMAVPGLTFSAIGGGYHASGNVFAVNPQNPIYSFYGNFSASTGVLVFGHDGYSDFAGRHDEIGHLWNSDYIPVSLRVDFLHPTDFFSIDFIADDFSDFGGLQAFNSSGTLLATYTTGNLSRNAFEAMSITRPQADISYVIATGVFGNSGGLDHILYDTIVPEPGVIILFLCGFLPMAFAVRKHNKRPQCDAALPRA